MPHFYLHCTVNKCLIDLNNFLYISFEEKLPNIVRLFLFPSLLYFNALSYHTYIQHTGTIHRIKLYFTADSYCLLYKVTPVYRDIFSRIIFSLLHIHRVSPRLEFAHTQLYLKNDNLFETVEFA